MIISNKIVKQALDWTGRKIHSPEQRLVLGATALATQPFIDLKNKDVEKVAGASSTNEKSIFPIAADKLEKKFELYRKAMGTFVATIAMIGTNFLLDAPLTKYFTGVFQKSLANVKLDENPVPKKEAEVKQ